MKRMNKRKTVCLTLAALALVAVLNVGNALAYFTDYIVKTGDKELELGFSETEFYEEIEPGRKVVWIQNTGEYPGYIRMRAFAGNNIILSYKEGDESKPQPLADYMIQDGSWTQGDDGYWYYSAILEPGACTKPIEITFNQPSDVESYNVIVVSETTPVLYDDTGAAYPDWDASMMTGPDDTTNGPTSELSEKQS